MRPVNGEEMEDGNAFPPFFISTTKPVKAHSRRERNQFKGRDPRTPTAPHSLNATPPQTWEDQVTVSGPASQLTDRFDERVRRA